ncbi:MAG: glycosyltransferase family 4 protein, partial [Bacteroidia bacterium]
WSEGMPNVILEAMANGLAIIATNVGATNILVNTHTGWLIEQCATKEIESALLSAISSSPTFIDSKKTKALNTIKQKFVWEKLVVELIQKLKALA